MKRMIVITLLMAMLIGLLVLCPASPAQAQSATPTVTFTPIATTVRASSTGYTLPSGATLVVESKATMGETILIIVSFAIIAVLGIRFVYQLAVDWGK